MIGTTISSNGDSVEYKGSSKYLDTQTSLTVFRDPPRGTWLPKRYYSKSTLYKQVLILFIEQISPFHLNDVIC